MKRMSKGMRSAVDDYHHSVEMVKRSLKRVAMEAIKDGGNALEIVRRLTNDGVDPTDVMFTGVLPQKVCSWISKRDPDYVEWTKRMYRPLYNVIDYGGLMERYMPEPEIRLEERREY